MKLVKRYTIKANDVPQKIEDSITKELTLLKVSGVAYIQDEESRTLYHRFYRNGQMYDMYPKLAQEVKKYVKFKTAGQCAREMGLNLNIRSSLVCIETDEFVYLTALERYIVDDVKYPLAVKVHKLHDALKLLGFNGDLEKIPNLDFRSSRSVGRSVGSVQPSDQSKSRGRLDGLLESIIDGNSPKSNQVGRSVGSVQPTNQPSDQVGRFEPTNQPTNQPSVSSNNNIELLLKQILKNQQSFKTENEENLLTLVKLASDILETNKQILEELKTNNSLLREINNKEVITSDTNCIAPPPQPKVPLNLHGEVTNTAKKYEENNRRQLLDGRFILGVLRKYEEYTSFGYSKTKTFRLIREDLEGRDEAFAELYKEYSSVNVKFKGGREALGKIIDSYTGLEGELELLKDNPDIIPDKLQVTLSD